MTEIVHRTLSQLETMRHSGNPKDHDVAGIAASIARFGFTLPIAIDLRSDTIVAGHGRLKALRLLHDRDPSHPPARVDASDVVGDWMIPTVGFVFVDDDERDAYLIADNKLQESGGYNEQALAAIMARFGPDADLRSMGYTRSEYDKLMAKFAPPQPEPERARDVMPRITITFPDVARYRAFELELKQLVERAGAEYSVAAGIV